MKHNEVTTQTHVPCTQEFANEIERQAFTGALSSDLYKASLQVDTMQFYILTSINEPIQWKILGNTPPVANPDFAACNENSSVLINLLVNDFDAEFTPISIVSITDPSNGSVIDHGNGTVTYTPDADYFGLDIFEYTIEDGGGKQDTGIATVAVNENDPPTANPDNVEAIQNVSIVIDLLSNDTDPDSDELTIINLTSPSHGTLFNHGNGTVTYTPNTNYLGSDSFNYTISDGKDAESTSTASITVNIPPNTAPVANPDSVSTKEGISVLIDLLANDTDPENDTLTVTNITSPSNGSLVNHGNGTVTYTPNTNFVGSDSFNYTISDGELTNTNTASVTVTNVTVEQNTTLLNATGTFNFSNGNKKATRSATSNWTITRSIPAITSKTYVEMLIGGTYSSDYAQIGVITEEHLTQHKSHLYIGNNYDHPTPGFEVRPPADAGWCISLSSTTCYHNSVGKSFSPPGELGDRIGIAVDPPNHRIWQSVNGVQINSGNPSTALNPVYTNVPNEVYFAFDTIIAGISAEFKSPIYPVPTGYVSLY